MSGSLKAVQRQVMMNYLQSCRIQDATIYGIGESLKYSLRLYGFVTAADIDQYSVQRVPGIGSSKAAAIEVWRQHRVNEAFSKYPAALHPSEFHRIESKYKQQRQWLESQRNAEQAKLNAEIVAIRSRYASAKPPLDAEQVAAQDKANRDRQAIADRYAPEYARLSHQLSLLSKEYVEKHTLLDEDAAQVRQKLLEHNWQFAKIQHELTPFSNISFNRYLRAACFGYHGK